MTHRGGPNFFTLNVVINLEQYELLKAITFLERCSMASVAREVLSTFLERESSKELTWQTRFQRKVDTKRPRALYIRVPNEHREALRIIAAHEHRSQSDVMREALQDYLNEYTERKGHPQTLIKAELEKLGFAKI